VALWGNARGFGRITAPGGGSCCWSCCLIWKRACSSAAFGIRCACLCLLSACCAPGWLDRGGKHIAHYDVGAIAGVVTKDYPEGAFGSIGARTRWR